KALKDETAFRGWIFKILSNKCKKKIAEYMKTRENISMVPLDDMENNITSENNVEDETINKVMVEKAFKSLSYEDRLIVTMVVYGGYNSREIGKELGLNRNTVRTRYSRALAAMQRTITFEDNVSKL
nr:sigma-70 family RNA polymerase sigma factor [Lachnospiraceae bacterium]